MMFKSVLSAGIGVTLCSVTSFGQSPFTIVALPDTQNYARLNASTPGGPNDFFLTQTRWITQNAAAQNIVFATHLGDIVNDASTPNGANPGSPNAQWNVAVNAMNVLKNSNVPHAILPGNHDWTSASGTGNLTHYRTRFGDASDYYAGKSWSLGYDPIRGANSAQRFSTPVGEMLHLSLEWNAFNPATSSDRPSATGNALNWAQQIINQNPGTPTIISTHNHLRPDGTRDASGEGLFNSLIRNNSQIFMVLNGHYIGESQLTSTNNAGQPVYQLLADYQGRNRGGDGWMRLLSFDPANNRINVRTYTPVTSGVSTTTGGVGPTMPAPADLNNVGLIEVDADSQFSLPLDFRTRFQAPPATIQRSFQNGVDGYNATQDTYLAGDNPNANFGTENGVWVDGLSTNLPTHGLIRFDQLFSGTNAIDPTRDIVSARIRIRVEGDNAQGSGFVVHRMERDWNENTATWNSLGQGISADGFEALAVATTTIGVNANSVGVPLGYAELDVTADLRAILNGATNNGWALLPFTNGSNGVRFESSEATLTANRPQLIIDQTEQQVQVRVFRNGLNNYQSTIDTELRQSTNQRNAVRDASVHLLVDESYGSPAGRTQALLRFDELVGNNPQQIPEDGQLISAILKLNVNDAGSGVSLHRMLVGWNESDTWQSLFEGVSINDIEASSFVDGSAGLGSSGASVDYGFYYFDVSAAVRSWMADPSSNHGWLIQSLPGGIDGLRFDSSETLRGLRPELIVRFLPASASLQAVPEPGALSLAVAAALSLMRRSRRAIRGA